MDNTADYINGLSITLELAKLFSLPLDVEDKKKIGVILTCMRHSDNYVDSLKSDTRKKGAADIVDYLRGGDISFAKEPELAISLTELSAILKGLNQDRRELFFDSVQRIFTSGETVSQTKNVRTFISARKMEGLSSADAVLIPIDAFYNSYAFRKFYRRMGIVVTWLDTVSDYVTDRRNKVIAVPPRVLFGLCANSISVAVKIFATHPSKKSCLNLIGTTIINTASAQLATLKK